MKKGKNFIGTSGWNYDHWVNEFYPEDISKKDWLQFYVEKGFKTVELNIPFYHLPKNSTYVKWHDSVPEDFIYSVKASRYITHVKKLHEAQESVEKLFDGAKELKEKLGPFLFQLPPGLKADSSRLINFMKKLPDKFRYTFEFRNDTWWNYDILEILNNRNMAFCIYELGDVITSKEVTADFIYIRVHGPGGKYKGDYDKKNLSDWADFIKSWIKKSKDVYCYFDNDQNGYAAKNALELKELTE
jgi:uncharacterized protein YecE (DUF72 family)